MYAEKSVQKSVKVTSILWFCLVLDVCVSEIMHCDTDLFTYVLIIVRVCAGAGACMILNTCEGQGTIWGSRFLPSTFLKQLLLFLSSCLLQANWLSASGPASDSSCSTHLAGVLGLQMHTTVSSFLSCFYVGSGEQTEIVRLLGQVPLPTEPSRSLADFFVHNYVCENHPWFRV